MTDDISLGERIERLRSAPDLTMEERKFLADQLEAVLMELSRVAVREVIGEAYRGTLAQLPEKPNCNHDLQSPDKTLKATGAPRFGWHCTVCKGEWYPEKVL